MVGRLDLLKRLDESLWFQLSMAGQELFHSNMLYWLAKHRPDESAPVWDLLAPGLGLPSGAKREAKNIDLAIECVAGKLILENKVFALPRAKQLQDYHDRLKLSMDKPTAWRLLSLIPARDVPAPWRAVNYSELLSPLRAVHLREGEECMLKAYVGLVELLVEVAEAFDPEQEPDCSVFLSFSEMGRASAVIQKLRMHRCAGWIQDRLTHNAPLVVPGFTRGQGLIEAFAESENGIQYGWQLQDRRFRLAIRTIANQRKQPDVFREHARILDDFMKIPGHDYIEFDANFEALFDAKSSQRLKWNKFGVDFIYKYRNLRPDIHWRDLVDLCVYQTEKALRFVSERKTG